MKDIDEKRVDILLVGQDWGAPGSIRNKTVIDNIREIQAGKDVKYDADGPTDRTLADMFTVFGDDINIMDKKLGMRLFFTNYSLGYREGSETGGMTKTIMRQDKKHFDNLVLSIRPRIIICLGKITYEMVSGMVAKRFVDTLRKGTPFKAQFPLDKSIPVYGVAHCGSRGQYNVGGIVKMKEAWKVIAEEYKAMEQMKYQRRK